MPVKHTPKSFQRSNGSGKSSSKARREERTKELFALLPPLNLRCQRLPPGPRSRKTLEEGEESLLKPPLPVEKWTREQRRARDELVLSNLGLIHWVLQRYFRRLPSELQEDAYHEGVFGLMRAIDTFDLERGVQFSTYAIFWVRAKIQRRMEIVEAQRLGMSPGRYRRFPGERPIVGSLHHIVGDGDGEDGRELIETLADDSPPVDETVHHTETSRAVRDRLDEWVWEQAMGDGFGDAARKSRTASVRIDVLERRLLSEGDGTLDEIGREYGISRERVRQIEGKVVDELREALADVR